MSQIQVKGLDEFKKKKAKYQSWLGLHNNTQRVETSINMIDNLTVSTKGEEQTDSFCHYTVLKSFVRKQGEAK